MRQTLKDLLTSKKALVTAAGIASWVVGRAGFDLPASELLPVMGMLASYVFGQSIADVGKNRKRITDVLVPTPLKPEK